jgi:hypothetical protein
MTNYAAMAAGLLTILAADAAAADELCHKYGPQTPRDIAMRSGANARHFPLADPAKELNLCNIHFHAQAEHKGPGFSLSAGKGEHGGFKCNETTALTAEELKAPAGDVCHGLRAGDTVEVHWVYTSCDVAPGKGLGSCMSEQCANPVLRVESQVFLLTNNGSGLKFADFSYDGGVVNGVHQPKALPAGTGQPVVFRGSTTGPSYTQEKCSPLQVTWSVRPACAKLDLGSLSSWCSGNPFQEDHAHGVRDLVTAPELLAEIR